MTDAIELSVVAFEQDGVWTAQALEHDIAAFSDSLPKVMKKFERALFAETIVNREFGREGLTGIRPAPDRYWRMFEQAGLDVKARAPVAIANAPGRIRDIRIAEAA